MITFFLFGIDKWFAKRNIRRISEENLLGFSFIGGALGGLMGMIVFNHKTAKFSFIWKLVMVLMSQIALLIFMRI